METQISLRLPQSLLADIDRRADSRGINRSRVIRELIESALQGRVADSAAPYDKVRDLVGSVSGAATGASRRDAMLQTIRDRRG